MREHAVCGVVVCDVRLDAGRFAAKGPDFLYQGVRRIALLVVGEANIVAGSGRQADRRGAYAAAAAGNDDGAWMRHGLASLR